MSKLVKCKSCEAEVSKSAAVCPNCGKQLKTGLFTKLVVVVLVFGVVGAIFAPTKEEQTITLLSKLTLIEQASASKLTPTGELNETFSLMSRHTDIQRDNLEQEITGSIVQWRLPVYEVSKKKDMLYRIQTAFGGVGTILNIHARNESEKNKIEALKTGDNISFKGRISGVSMRHIMINDAILM